jgi:sigma-B regulation protein RsbU (phosphoserine phosphatase)
VDAPEFVRRQREERRLSYEMELLSRMQVGLLPSEPPRLAGWDLAASSMLAHEVGGDFYDFLFDRAGRLWIAAGDVAGHGSFCSIGHAMTKAALASLIDEGEGEETTPSAVLLEVDRVLRTVDNRRMFTALALLRLEPATGRALVANGGYPYPLLRLLPETAPAEPAPTRVVELELPGLPLGEGPPRRYQDLEITVPPGGVLVLSSDGLFEAMGRGERPYGFDRPRQVVARSSGDSAEGILTDLVDDWRRFVGTAPLADDTTLVVVRRTAHGEDAGAGVGAGRRTDAGEGGP